jgi:hypothetical protein
MKGHLFAVEKPLNQFGCVVFFFAKRLGSNQLFEEFYGFLGQR